MRAFIYGDKIIQNIIKKRYKYDSELFFVDTHIVSAELDVNVIKKKQLYGIELNSEIILPPIFDEIILLTHSIAAIKIEDRISLYDIRENMPITGFSYKSMQCIGSYWKLYEDSRKFILFDTIKDKIFKSDGRYDEYNLRCEHTEYFWARRGTYFDYIHRGTGKCISLPGIIMAYDTETRMFGKNENGTISLFDDTGIENAVELRKIVCEAGGHFTLTNYTYNIQHIIDVYGNILNI